MRQPTLLDLPGDPTGTVSTALLSPCRTYRYRLTRVWDRTLPRAVFIMLNPSTADATVDDPTIGRCRWFARREGCGSLDVVNLFALRSTDPKVLRHHPAPVGPENDFHLRAVLIDAPKTVIAAWGSHAPADRAAHVQELLAEPLRKIRAELSCLGTTQSGQPRHPLYLRKDTPLVPLRRAS